MITGVDSSTQRFLTDLASNSRRLEQAQRQLTSGKRIEIPSDDPDQVSALVQYRSELSIAVQSQVTLSRVKAEVDTSESAIASAVKLMERARVIGAQGATGTATADMRASIASELGSILEQVVAIANTTVGGRYVFSGDNDQQPAYSIDMTQSSPVSPFAGTPSTRQVLDANGISFQTARTAQEIFDSTAPGEGVFGSINQLRLALLANDPNAVMAAASDATSAGTYLNGQLAFYGAVQNRVNAALSEASAVEVRMKSQISSLEDADMVQAATDLSNASFLRNAALSARAHAPRVSLFDFLG